MSHIKKSSTRRSDDTMDDDSDDKDSKRKSRNLSEKKRRDQFNLLVNELSSMVSTGGRKMDKSTVLKSTISFLKKHNEIAVRSRVNEIQEDWKPTFLTNEEFTHLVLEAVDGFIIVFSTNGQIYYASESITSLLGYLPNDILNMTLYELASEEEQSNLYNILLSPSEEQGQITFSCHLRRGDSESKICSCYELVQFVGYFKIDDDTAQTDNNIYNGYGGDDEQRLVFVGTGRIQTPQLIKEMPLVDSSKSEFTSRHSLEWKFLFLDHRAPPIIGYLPFELLGTSGYDYYHIDDLDKVVSCHESLIQKGEGTSCYYRFLTKGQQWIWIQTRFYITYHQWNSKPEFIVCTHRVVSYADVLNHSKKEDIHKDLHSRSLETTNSWHAKSSNLTSGSNRDCISMSADSPESAHSVMTQQTVNSVSTHGRQQQQVNQSDTPSQSQQHKPVPQPINPQSQFLEPTQNITAIPVQPIVANFPSSTVFPSHITMENLVMTPPQSQLQADLQKKHAELQAIIGQQQQELRRVSEQLFMARLGFLPSTSQAQSVQNVPIISYQTASSATVSSTTSISLPTEVPPSVIVPIPISLPHPQHHQQQHMTYTMPMPDSNNQTNEYTHTNK